MSVDAQSFYLPQKIQNEAKDFESEYSYKGNAWIYNQWNPFPQSSPKSGTPQIVQRPETMGVESEAR